ncbi:hypothetical protein HH308_05430 [Gordonia sp. TBRC 11910]|uniref:Lipoprotein n=2 Tax=Gordonia asplenii TaxID=2725283 RepID=A0A848KPQ7_9ACTN|nr:hypothetical protein [Gordonia asplenii]
MRTPGAVAMATAALGGLAACGTDAAVSTASSPTSKPVSVRSAVVADSECQQTPPTGTVDRTGSDLNFHSGEIRISLVPTATTPTTVPAPTPPPVPVAPTSSAAATSSSAAPAAPASQCFGYRRWGNSDPSVPPDSLLFAFKGDGSGGAQVSFFVGDLTGGGPPPAGGVRHVVPALVAPINAQVGVSANGTYYQATQCSLKITAMSSTRAAAFFQCPTATTSKANPFDPSDDVSYDSDETAASSAVPGAPQAPSETPRTALLSGWFSVSR